MFRSPYNAIDLYLLWLPQVLNPEEFNIESARIHSIFPETFTFAWGPEEEVYWDEDIHPHYGTPTSESD